MAEDFTTWTENDVNGVLTVTSTKITAVVWEKQDYSSVYKNYSLSSLVHFQFETQVTGGSAANQNMLFCITDSTGAGSNGYDVSGFYGMGASIDYNTGSPLIHAKTATDGVNDWSTGVSISLNTTYYVDVVIDASNVTVKVYSDSGFSTQVGSTQTVSVISGSYGYLCLIGSGQGAYTDSIDGFVQNLSIISNSNSIYNQFTAFSFDSYTLNGSNKKLSCRFTAQESKTVTILRLYSSLINGSSPFYRVGLQGDSSGDPSGIWLGATNSGYGDSQFSDHSWAQFTLGETVSLTTGTVYHLVVEYQSGTIDIYNAASIRVLVANSSTEFLFQPLNKSNSDINFPDSNFGNLSSSDGGSSWALNTGWGSVFLLDYSDGTYGGQPNNNRSPNSLHSNHWISEKITVANSSEIDKIGFNVRKTGTPADDLYYEIRDASETVLRSGTLVVSSVVTTSYTWYDVFLSTPLTLVSGTTYRVVFKSPNSDLSNYYNYNYPYSSTTTLYENETYGGTSSCYSYSTNSGVSWVNKLNGDIPFRLLSGFKSFTVDALLKASGLTKTFSVDSLIQQQNLTKTFTADAILKSLKTFTSDAILLSPETGFEIFVNEVDYTENALNYEFIKEDNEISSFNIELIGTDSTARTTDLLKNKVVKLISQDTLIFKGILDRPEYKTGETTVIKGFGAGESYCLRKTADTTASSSSDSSTERPTYEIVNVSTIISEQATAVSEITVSGTDDGSTLGSGTFRGEHVSVLAMIANPVMDKDGKWWFTYGSSPYTSNIYHASTSRGSGSSIETFAISGSNQNANETKNEQDFDALVNSVTVLGYGDGINQLSSKNFHATLTRSTLSADLNSTSSTINVTDTTSFPSSGNAWIGVEKISYTGKTATTLTGCTRAVDWMGSQKPLNWVTNTTGYAHTKGIEVYDAQYTESSPETGSSINSNENGLKQKTFQKKEVVDQDTLDRITQKIAADKKNLVEKITLLPTDIYTEARLLNPDDTITITDADSELSSKQTTIKKISIKSKEGLEELILECTNAKENFSGKVNDFRDISEVESKYMQGATNIFAINETDNLESGDTSPAALELFFNIPEDSVAINSIKLSYRNEAPKVWSNVTAAGSSHTHALDTTIMGSTGGNAGGPTMVSGSISNADATAWKNIGSSFSGPNGYPGLSIVQAYTTDGGSSLITMRIYNSTEGTYYPNLYGLVVAVATNNDSSSNTILLPSSASADTLQLQCKISTGTNDKNVTMRLNSPYITSHTHSLVGQATAAESAHTHAVNYNLAAQTYTTTDLKIWTTDDASSTPTWTERTTAIETTLGRTLTATNNGSENNLNLTSYFSNTIGWKGIKISVNGNSRHKVQAITKCFIQSK